MMLKHYRWLIVSLAVVFLSSCKNLPEKPNVMLCGVGIEIDGEMYIECSMNQDVQWLKLPIIDALGYQCMPPSDVAAIKRYLVKLDEHIKSECGK